METKLLHCMRAWSKNELYDRLFTDQLTGALNRSAYELLKNPCSAVAIIDLDSLKFVNDTYGHLTGDKVLQELAEVLRNNIRKTDYLGRIGGEEFALLLPLSSLSLIEQHVERCG